jgi:hypothetical protein
MKEFNSDQEARRAQSEVPGLWVTDQKRAGACKSLDISFIRNTLGQ